MPPVSFPCLLLPAVQIPRVSVCRCCFLISQQTYELASKKKASSSQLLRLLHLGGKRKGAKTATVDDSRVDEDGDDTFDPSLADELFAASQSSPARVGPPPQLMVGHYIIFNNPVIRAPCAALTLWPSFETYRPLVSASAFP